jgi:hypothetical protein
MVDAVVIERAVRIIQPTRLVPYVKARAIMRREMRTALLLRPSTRYRGTVGPALSGPVRTCLVKQRKQQTSPEHLLAGSAAASSGQWQAPASDGLRTSVRDVVVTARKFAKIRPSLFDIAGKTMSMSIKHCYIKGAR